MDYICYVSRQKVDHLYDQIEPAELAAGLSYLSNTYDGHNGKIPPAAAFALNHGLTYGRPKALQLERKVKAKYVEKLRDVLTSLYANESEIIDFRSAIDSGSRKSIYYFHEGAFRCTPPLINVLITKN